MNSGGYLQLAQTICRRIKYFLATQLTQYSFSDSMTMTHQTDARPQEYDNDVIVTEITDGGARDSLFSRAGVSKSPSFNFNILKF
jgi:hypothetical protein